MKRWIVAALLALAVLAGGWAADAARVIKVCPAHCEFNSIQAAVDAVAPGGYVFVRAGVYRESVRVVGRDGLNLLAEPGESVTIAAEGRAGITVADSRAVVIQGVRVVGAGPGLLADNSTGLTLLDSQIESSVGAGVRLVRTAATLRGNIVLDTRFDEDGAGGQAIAIAGGSVTLDHNAVLNNAGFGVLASGAASVLIEDNTISGNGVLGIGLVEQVSATIQRNLIAGQRPSAEGRFGRGIEVASSGTVFLFDNWVQDNASAGIAALAEAQVVMMRNTVRRTAGYGLLLVGGAQVVAAENLVSENAGAGIAVGQTAGVTLVDNDVLDNAGAGISVGFTSFAAETTQVTAKQNRLQGNAACAVAVDGDAEIAVAGEANRSDAPPDPKCDPAGKLPEGFYAPQN